MALHNAFEKSGNFLFKYRGQIPVVIFLIALPFVYFGNYAFLATMSSSSAQNLKLIVLICSIIISISGFLIRAYTIGTTPRGTSGRNTDKQVAKVLNTKGIYSIVRHPLYLGNYLMWAGLLIFTMNISLFVIISLLFWLYYERIMFAEEAFLQNQFGDTFLKWSMKVPAFFPSIKNFEKGTIPFSFKAVLRREYTGIFAMVFAYTLTDYWMQFTFHNRMACGETFQWCRPPLYILAIALLILILLRTLKHKTKLLDPDENRD